MKLLMSVAETAEVLGVCTRSVIRNFEDRGLPTKAIGSRVMIRPRDLAAWINNPPAGVPSCTVRNYKERLPDIYR